MDWRYNTIWFDQLPPETYVNYDFSAKDTARLDISSAEYLILWHHRNKAHTFADIPPSKRLLYLEINHSNSHDFRGLENFPNLKRLELHHCVKLSSSEGLESVSRSIEHLHVQLSKKFSPSADLLALKNLRVLALNSCGVLESLDFLQSFPRLIDFRFVHTNILDGKLDALLAHPTLRRVGFLNKKHYNKSDAEIKDSLAKKEGQPQLEYVHRGEYRTYRYA